MIIRIDKLQQSDNEHLKDAFAIRNLVFVKEQNVTVEEEFDGLDHLSEQYLVFYDEKPVATARWRETEEGIKLERFATLKKYRRKMLGALLLNLMLDEVVPKGKKIYLNAQVTAEKFYERHGFSRVGEMFSEANIDHYKMVYSKK